MRAGPVPLLLFLPIVGLAFTSLAPAAGLGPSSDSCHLRELEICAIGGLSILQNPNGLPVREVELKRQCEFFNESVQCFEDFKGRCLHQLQVSVLDLFTSQLNGLAEQFCEPQSELRKNYTRHVACLRNIQRKFQRRCATDLQVGFEAIHKTSADLRLATACW